MTLDLSVYAVVDPTLTRGRDPVALVERVARSGGTLVQLRDKHAETRLLVAEARALVTALRPTKVPLLVNDRVDVALAAEAHGVHLGQTDMAADDARRLLGPRAVIGLTIRTEAEARDTPIAAADYVALGGVFGTTSKVNDTLPLGLDGLARLVRLVRERTPMMPICAIAGITAANAAGVIAAGVDGVAVISEIFMAEDPAAATRTLAAVVAGALAARRG